MFRTGNASQLSLGNRSYRQARQMQAYVEMLSKSGAAMAHLWVMSSKHSPTRKPQAWLFYGEGAQAGLIVELLVHSIRNIVR